MQIGPVVWEDTHTHGNWSMQLSVYALRSIPRQVLTICICLLQLTNT